MKSRTLLVWMCAILGLLCLAAGWLIPVYLRAVDARVLERAGKPTPTLVSRGLDLVNQKKLGAAELLLEAARQQGLPDRAELGLAVTNLAAEHPGWKFWGGGESHLEILFASAGKNVESTGASATVSEPLTDWIVRLENRDRVLELLRASPRPIVQQLLRSLQLTNTVIFPAAESASGQAYEAAVSICGMLSAEDKLTPGLSNSVFTLATAANRGASTQPLEEVLLDFMSLGQRLDWGQLTVFIREVRDVETLRILGNILRKAESQLPVLFTAVVVSGNPAGVAQYWMNFSQTGLNDLAVSLRFGAGGLNEMLQRQQRLYSSARLRAFLPRTGLGALAGFGVDYAQRLPALALALKWLLYLAAGFLLAMALHFAWPPFTGLEAPLRVRGFHFAREFLFAMGFLVVVLILSEPFLAQENQKAEVVFRLRLPTVGNPVAAGTIASKSSFMDPKSLLTLLLFFVLQALLYTACLVKLAEISRQRVPPRIKLRLLENEDHLFDAGLYLGFAGTIISLILVSLGVIKQSLMAAYSSTSFGIIFVSIFKIFHLRPARRKLVLEAEAETSAPAPVPARPLAAPL